MGDNGRKALWGKRAELGDHHLYDSADSVVTQNRLCQELRGTRKGKILLLDVELFDEKMIILQGKYFEFRSEQG